MLFCVTSIIERSAASVVDVLVSKGFLKKVYNSGMISEIMDNAGWKKDLVILLENPSDWLEFHIRPFSVLIIVHPMLTEKDELKHDRCNFYHTELLKVRRSFLNKTNLIEIREDETEKISAHATRPTWQEYFISLAQIVASRSNCMKRKVGAVIVKNNRVLCIGYNGTSTSTVNCCDGGCDRCNNNIRRGKELANCFCIHAEESAFLERNSLEIHGAELYTTVYPCRLCSRKIVQLHIAKVYYIYEYVNDEEVRRLFRDNKIEVHRLKE